MAFAGGDGTAGNPYQISIWAHLDDVRNNLDKYFILINDLDRSTAGYHDYASPLANAGLGWNGIGATAAPFTGNFNGNKYAISDLFIDRNTTAYIGLFAYTDAATISNLGVLDADVTDADGRAGVLVGIARTTTLIEYCHTTGTITTGANGRTGGLVGHQTGTIRNSYSTVTVTSTGPYVGGLVGEGGYIYDSYATGNVDGGSDYRIGGLLGNLRTGGDVNRCYATGDVTGNNIGGLAGRCYGTIQNSYAKGDVSRVAGGSSSAVGGFVGNADEGTSISDSYSKGKVSYIGARDPTTKGFVGYEAAARTYSDNFFDKQTSGQNSSVGATGENTVDMYDYDTFNDAGWDIVPIGKHDGKFSTSVWYIDDGNDYPRLWFERGLLKKGDLYSSLRWRTPHMRRDLRGRDHLR